MIRFAREGKKGGQKWLKKKKLKKLFALLTITSVQIAIFNFLKTRQFAQTAAKAML